MNRHPVRPRPRAAGFAPQFEVLDDLCLLVCTLLQTGGLLTLTGNNGRDDVRLGDARTRETHSPIFLSEQLRLGPAKPARPTLSRDLTDRGPQRPRSRPQRLALAAVPSDDEAYRARRLRFLLPQGNV